MTEERKEIDQLFKIWREAIRNSDAKKISELVTEDATFWTHRTPELKGRKSVLKTFESFFERYQSDQEFDCRELILSGEWAIARGMEVNHLTPRGGGEPMVVRQRGFSIIKRGKDGKWRFARGMTHFPPEEE